MCDEVEVVACMSSCRVGDDLICEGSSEMLWCAADVHGDRPLGHCEDFEVHSCWIPEEAEGHDETAASCDTEHELYREYYTVLTTGCAYAGHSLDCRAAGTLKSVCAADAHVCCP